jgi:ATP-dependent Clp protease ATP-binding subunit ClpB
LKGLTKILAEQNIELEITDEALTYLSMHGYEPQFGARPLKRLIQKEIVNLLSKKIIAGDIDKAKKVIVDSFEDAIIIRN